MTATITTTDKETTGAAQAAQMLATLTQWANDAQTLHDNNRATTERAPVESWALTAPGEAFYQMPVTPRATYYGSPLRRDGGALAMAATLWPGIVSFTGEEMDTDRDREKLEAAIESAFHIARVALVAGMATMATLDRRPGVDGALELLQAAAAVAAQCLEPDTGDGNGAPV